MMETNENRGNGVIISKLIKELEQFKSWHGDIEMEFAVISNDESNDRDVIYCEFDKLHDSNLDSEKTCCLYVVADA